MGFGPHNNRLYSERHEQEVVELYVDDERSLAEVEAATGVNKETVRAILRRQEVRTRPVGCGRTQEPLPTLELTRTAWLHSQGLTYEQIGELLGLSVDGVKHRIATARRRLNHPTVTRGANNRPKRTIPVHVRRAVETWNSPAPHSI